VHKRAVKIHHDAIHTEQGQQRHKRKEERISKLLQQHNILFKREHRIELNCLSGTYARVDFVMLIGGGVLILEVDEDQHAAYGIPCEISRMTKLYESLLLGGNTLPVGIIRYNPDAYTVNGVKISRQQKEREAKLLSTIRAWSFDNPLILQYMYYDAVSDVSGTRLLTWDDPSYCQMLKKCCALSVV
jgi:hypothetical protein